MHCSPARHSGCGCKRRTPRKSSPEFSARGWAWRRSEILPSAVEVRAEADVTDTEAYRHGLFEVQDLGSQMILASVGVEPGGRWLDACAGAGGKTLQLAALLGPGRQIVAHDIRPAALAELELRAQRAGAAVAAAITATDQPTGRFDGVLVDAPCSGSGTWRRAPHLKWTTDPGANRGRQPPSAGTALLNLVIRCARRTARLRHLLAEPSRERGCRGGIPGGAARLFIPSRWSTPFGFMPAASGNDDPAVAAPYRRFLCRQPAPEINLMGGTRGPARPLRFAAARADRTGGRPSLPRQTDSLSFFPLPRIPRAQPSGHRGSRLRLPYQAPGLRRPARFAALPHSQERAGYLRYPHRVGHAAVYRRVARDAAA